MLGLAVRQGLDYNYLPATDILDGIRKVTDVLVAGVVLKYQWLLGGNTQKNPSQINVKG